MSRVVETIQEFMIHRGDDVEAATFRLWIPQGSPLVDVQDVIEILKALDEVQPASNETIASAVEARYPHLNAIQVSTWSADGTVGTLIYPDWP